VSQRLCGEKEIFVRLMRRLFLIISILFIFAGLIGTTKPSWSSSSQESLDAKPELRRLNSRLLQLEPNVWVKIKESSGLHWHRQAHAGIAYDSKRGTLLIFGSDTHGYDWDNEVHEFDPRTETWTTHYKRAPKDTYRADASSRAIAGTDRLMPWAMHTFDNIVYDPGLDAIVVTALPAHNPIRKQVPDAKVHPTWIYDLSNRQWHIFHNNGKPSPTFFAAASAYDSHRNVIVAYGKIGLWELGPGREEWKKATSESHHEIHFNMDYDSKHRVFAVFGDYRNTNVIWVYKPSHAAGERGIWEKKIPEGDLCPRDQHFPVAFDHDNSMFLLVPDNNRFTKGKNGRNRFLRGESSSTFIYDLETNRYTKLPRADMHPLKMNYMMVYDKFHKVFLLVTGDHSAPITVWALKLDLKALGVGGISHVVKWKNRQIVYWLNRYSLTLLSGIIFQKMA